MIDADTVAAIRRYREQALNGAALVAALATTHVDDDSRLRELATRQDDQLRDLLHDFAYKARKTIELADRAGIPISDEVERKSIVGIPEPRTAKSEAELDSYSLGFVLGRIIHSDAFRVERGMVPDGYDGDTLFHHEAAWAFNVRSDFDPPGKSHFVFVEFLLQRFLEIDEHVGRYLERLAYASEGPRAT